MKMTKNIRMGLIGGLCGAGIGWLGAQYEVDRIAEPMRHLPPRIDEHKAQLQKVERMRWAMGKALGEECVESIWERLQFGLPVSEVSARQSEHNVQLCPGDAATINATVMSIEAVRVVHTQINDAISTGEQAASYLAYNDSPLNLLPILTAMGTGMVGSVAAVGAMDLVRTAHTKENQ